MRQFLSRLDHDRIVSAIRKAESSTSGEIRVHVTRRKPKDLELSARLRFVRLGMDRTAAHNGVLFYFCPNQRRFQVFGDTGVHEKCGPAFWKEVASAMEEKLRQGDFTGGIVLGVEKVGELLARHFPRGAGDANELPDEVTED